MKNIFIYITSLIVIIISLLIIKTKFLNKFIPRNIDNSLNKNSFVQSKGDVEILNGCGQPGIANLFTHFLDFYNTKLFSDTIVTYQPVSAIEYRLETLKESNYISAFNDVYRTYDYGFNIQDSQNIILSSEIPLIFFGYYGTKHEKCLWKSCVR